MPSVSQYGNGSASIPSGGRFHPTLIIHLAQDRCGVTIKKVLPVKGRCVVLKLPP